MTSILLVDDEPLFAKGLRRSLEGEGYHVVVSHDGEEALRQVESRSFDLVLLDLMLPKVDGLTICRKIRAGFDIPIIMITAKDDDVDKIVGLELGADDYLTKPFNTRELLARIKAVLRRARGRRDAGARRTLRVGDIDIDTEKRRVRVSGSEVILTPTEHALLEILCRHPGRVYTRHRASGPGTDPNPPRVYRRQPPGATPGAGGRRSGDLEDRPPGSGKAGRTYGRLPPDRGIRTRL